MSVEQDLARARRKPIAEDKMKLLLAKARKGATASFTLTNLVQILDLLGWEIEPTYGWVPIHYMHSDGEQLVYEHGPQNPTAADLAWMEEKRQKFIAAQHTELPEAGPDTVGGEVVMDVSEMRKGYADLPIFDYRKWVGVEGVRFRSPRGEEIDVIPDRGDVTSYKKLVVTDTFGFATSDAWRATKELGIEEDINAALGTEKHIPAEQRTRENTGTCAHCWGNYKLDNDLLVLHGYKRPRYGYVVGKCRGVGYLPLEKSSLGAEDALQDLKDGPLAQWTEVKRALESGKVDKIETSRKGSFVNKGEPHFDYYLKEAIRRAKSMLEEIERDVALYEKVVANWHERPMPKEGEMQRGPGFFTKK